MKGTSPSDIWLRDLDALGDVLDDIAEVTRKQDIEDDKQRKNAAKRKVGGKTFVRGTVSLWGIVPCTVPLV